MNGACTSFGIQVAASIVDKDAAHHLRRDGEEVRAVIPFHIPLIDKSQERLVDEGRSLKRVAGPLTVHIVMGQTVELTVDERRHALESGMISIAPIQKQLSYLQLCAVVHLSRKL